jgi:putative transport protein
VSAAAVVGAAALIHATSGVGGGIFAGSVTSTPALAAAVGYLQQHASAAALPAATADPVVGYSLCYPLGVLIPLVAAHAVLKRDRSRGRPRLVEETARVEFLEGITVAELAAELEHRVAFGRIQHRGRVRVADAATSVRCGDLVTVVGTPEDVAFALDVVGERMASELVDDRSTLDFRRILVSNPSLAGRCLGDIGLDRLDATATRVRRGDADLVARPDLVLELGDHVRVVAPHDHFAQVRELLGDSYRSLRELDVLTFSLGIAAGMALGLVPLPLPGGGVFTLGFAGGPLILGLILGARERTGRLVWQLPQSANLTLRQFGTVLLLSGIGTKAGQSFAHTVSSPQAVSIAAAGAVITVTMVGLTLLAGGRLLRLPASQLTGMVAGVSTQPAVLAFATAHAADEDEVLVGYSTVYPLVMIAKIVAVQLVLAAIR